MKTRNYERGDYLDWTNGTGAEVAGGQPIQFAGRVGITPERVAAGKLSSLQIAGVVAGMKVTGAITNGQVVGWDSDGDPASGDSGSGCWTNVKADMDFEAGVCVADAASADVEVYFLLNGQPAGGGSVTAFDWQASIIDRDLTAPPGSPSAGDRYIVAGGGTGAWDGLDGQVVEYQANGTWDAHAPTEGMALAVEDEDIAIIHNGSAWVNFTVYLADGSVSAAKLASDSVITAKILDANVTRVKLAQENALVAIPLQAFRLNTLLELPTAGDGTNLGLAAGTHGSASPMLVGTAANSTSVSETARTVVPLPAKYVAGTDVTLRVHCRVDGDAQASQTLDAQVFEPDSEVGIGSELVQEAAQAIPNAWGDVDFTLDGTDLAPGDELDIELTAAVDDSAGSLNKSAEIGKVTLIEPSKV